MAHVRIFTDAYRKTHILVDGKEIADVTDFFLGQRTGHVVQLESVGGGSTIDLSPPELAELQVTVVATALEIDAEIQPPRVHRSDAFAAVMGRILREPTAKYFGCFTGDCPHDDVRDCIEALRDLAKDPQP